MLFQVGSNLMQEATYSAHLRLLPSPQFFLPVELIAAEDEIRLVGCHPEEDGAEFPGHLSVALL